MRRQMPRALFPWLRGRNFHFVVTGRHASSSRFVQDEADQATVMLPRLVAASIKFFFLCGSQLTMMPTAPDSYRCFHPREFMRRPRGLESAALTALLVPLALTVQRQCRLESVPTSEGLGRSELHCSCGFFTIGSRWAMKRQCMRNRRILRRKADCLFVDQTDLLAAARRSA